MMDQHLSAVKPVPYSIIFKLSYLLLAGPMQNDIHFHVPESPFIAYLDTNIHIGDTGADIVSFRSFTDKLEDTILKAEEYIERLRDLAARHRRLLLPVLSLPDDVLIEIFNRYVNTDQDDDTEYDNYTDDVYSCSSGRDTYSESDIDADRHSGSDSESEDWDQELAGLSAELEEGEQKFWSIPYLHV